MDRDVEQLTVVLDIVPEKPACARAQTVDLQFRPKIVDRLFRQQSDQPLSDHGLGIQPEHRFAVFRHVVDHEIE